MYFIGVYHLLFTWLHFRNNKFIKTLKKKKKKVASGIPPLLSFPSPFLRPIKAQDDGHLRAAMTQQLTLSDCHARPSVCAISGHTWALLVAAPGITWPS